MIALKGIGILLIIVFVMGSVIGPLTCFQTEHTLIAMTLDSQTLEDIDRGDPQNRLWIHDITTIGECCSDDNHVVIEFATRYFENEKIYEFLERNGIYDYKFLYKSNR